MIRLVIKLALAALIANAAWHVGSEYVTYFRFKDGVRNAATFRQGDDEDLRLRIEQLAYDYDIPLEEDQIQILSDEARSVDHSVVEVSYVKPVQVLPGYEHPFSFSFSVDTVFTKRF